MWLACVAQVSDTLSMLQGPSLLFKDHSIIFSFGGKSMVYLKKKSPSQCLLEFSIEAESIGVLAKEKDWFPMKN